MGKRVKNSTESSKLFCKFHSTNAFTKIAPFKLEIVNLQPFVGIFYNVLSDHESETLKKITFHKLKRGKVVATNGSYVFSKNRIAKIKFIYDDENEVVDAVNLRVADFSGLSVKTAEALQMQNYGIGGHYKMHHDFGKGEEEEELGDRVATALFYVSKK
jgi:prolyl 4-hydroxylase